MSDQDETKPEPSAFDFEAFPRNTFFHDRREGLERRDHAPVERPAPVLETARLVPPPERRAKKERRRRIDPTTFEKQYTDDELEFMNAMQRFKVQSGTSFPSTGDVLKVAMSLGYHKVVPVDHADTDPAEESRSDEVIEVATLFENG
jgi:hypothetical protein